MELAPSTTCSNATLVSTLSELSITENSFRKGAEESCSEYSLLSGNQSMDVHAGVGSDYSGYTGSESKTQNSISSDTGDTSVAIKQRNHESLASKDTNDNSTESESNEIAEKANNPNEDVLQSVDGNDSKVSFEVGHLVKKSFLPDNFDANKSNAKGSEDGHNSDHESNVSGHQRIDSIPANVEFWKAVKTTNTASEGEFSTGDDENTDLVEYSFVDSYEASIGVEELESVIAAYDQAYYDTVDVSIVICEFRMVIV